MANIRIRNKKTGEVKIIPEEQAGQFLGSTGQSESGGGRIASENTKRLIELNQRLRSSGGKPGEPEVSRTPAAVGEFVGSLAGNIGGPIGRIAGASAGAGIGEQVAQMQAGKPGDILAAGSFAPPIMALKSLERLKKSVQTGDIKELDKKSSVEKAQQAGFAGQLSGEALSGFLKFLKPGTASKFFDGITKELSKRGKGTVASDVIQQRFLNETLPKVLESGGALSEEQAISSGKKILQTQQPGRGFLKNLPSPSGIEGSTGAGFSSAKGSIDPQDLNFLRKQLNSFGKGQMDASVEKFIANDLARIIKEEQIKLVPEVGPAIGAQRAIKAVPELIRNAPLGRVLVGSGRPGGVGGLVGLLGGAASRLGGLAKFGLGPLVQSGTDVREE